MNNDGLGGYVKIYRSIIDWEWFDDTKTFCLFFYFLISASFKDSEWRGVKINKGDLICSVASISKKTGLSSQSIRTSINKLKSTGEITSRTTNKYTVITVVNYSNYQGIDEQLTNKTTSTLTNEQQTTNKQLTNNQQHRKNLKNVEKEKNVKNTEMFDSFWQIYPNKQAKQPALASWNKINPDDELFAVIIQAVRNQRTSEKWTKENGKYIPMPATWLNQKRWEDVLQVETAEPKKPVDTFFQDLQDGKFDGEAV